jgi:hypothetical protein
MWRRGNRRGLCSVVHRLHDEFNVELILQQLVRS